MALACVGRGVFLALAVALLLLGPFGANAARSKEGLHDTTDDRAIHDHGRSTGDAAGGVVGDAAAAVAHGERRGNACCSDVPKQCSGDEEELYRWCKCPGQCKVLPRYSSFSTESTCTAGSITQGTQFYCSYGTCKNEDDYTCAECDCR